MASWQRIILVLCAVVAALSLLWMAGEQHYQSCVQDAVAKSRTVQTWAGEETVVVVKQCDRVPW